MLHGTMSLKKRDITVTWQEKMRTIQGVSKLRNGIRFAAGTNAFSFASTSRPAAKPKESPIIKVPRGGGGSTSATQKWIWREFGQSVLHNSRVTNERNVHQHMVPDSITNLCLMLRRIWHYKFLNPCRYVAASRIVESTEIRYFWLPQFLTISRRNFDVFYTSKCNRKLAPDYWSRRIMAFIPKQVTTFQSVKWNYSFTKVDFRLTTGRSKGRLVTCHRRHRTEIQVQFLLLHNLSSRWGGRWWTSSTGRFTPRKEPGAAQGRSGWQLTRLLL